MSESNAIVEIPSVDKSVLDVRDVKRQVESLHNLFKQVMQKDAHYGVIPGTGDKPSLLKAGAEKIGLLLRLAPSFQHHFINDGDHLTVHSTCTLTHAPTGMVVASADAICSTKETKYAFRQATRKCPKCGAPAIIKGKAEYGGGWVCFKKKDGCGAKFTDDDPTIKGQSGDREDNPNLADTYNTVLKMADKRAYVAATLMGTAASDIFTQDVEDFGDFNDAPLVQTRQGGANGQSGPIIAYTSDEFEANLKDMEEAFERGEGADWWKANAKLILEHCDDEQTRRFHERKDELKAAGGSGGPPPSPQAPPDLAPAAEGEGAEGPGVLPEAPPSISVDDGAGSGPPDEPSTKGGQGDPESTPRFPHMTDEVLAYEKDEDSVVCTAMGEIRAHWKRCGGSKDGMRTLFERKSNTWRASVRTEKEGQILGMLRVKFTS